MTSRFVRYVGPPDVHDARVVALEHRGDRARVTIESYEGRQFALEFSGVAGVDTHQPIGMILYALVEVEASPPARRFEFVLADEESEARLAIEARGFTVVGDGMPPPHGV